MSKTPKLRFKEFSGDWESKKFKDIIKETRLGGNYANTESKTNYPLIKMGNIARGKIDLSKIEYIAEGEKLDNNDILKYGDLLFNTRNTLDLVGKVSVWKNELDLAFYNSNLMKLTFDEKFICNNYFMNYLFNTRTVLSRLKAIATGTTSVAAIYTRDLENIRLDYPCLEEQEKIASFFSLIDDKISLQGEKVEALKDYKRGMMQKIFSRELRFKDDEGGDYPEWEEKKLGDIIIIANKSNYLSGDAKEIGKFPFFINNTTDEYKFLDYSNLNGEYIISNTGGTAHFKYYNGEFAYMSDCLVFSTGEVEKFIYYYLKNKESYINYVGFYGSGIKHLDKKWFKNMKISLPCRKEQEKIANLLSGVDSKIKKEQKKLDSLNEYKKGLLQQMFV